MLIEPLELWMTATNAYVLAPESDGPAVVVDAPPDHEGRLASLLERRRLAPVALLVTHGHVDHMGGAGALVERTGVTAYIHPDDDYLTLHPEEQLRQLFGFTPDGGCRPPRSLPAARGRPAARLGRVRLRGIGHPRSYAGALLFLPAETGNTFLGRPAVRRFCRAHRPSGR